MTSAVSSADDLMFSPDQSDMVCLRMRRVPVTVVCQFREEQEKGGEMEEKKGEEEEQVE